MKLGLTGGIASGKSTTADFLRAWGAEVIDTDQLAHEAMVPGQPAYEEIVAHFGRGILNADGTIDRQRLGEIVFRNESERERLNQIVHPRVREQWKRRTAEVEASSERAVVVAMIPLLYETKVEKTFDTVLVVGCRRETQVRRMQQRGLNDDQIEARLRSQLPLSTKMEQANFVVWNEYSVAILDEQSRMVWNQISDIIHRRN